MYSLCLSLFSFFESRLKEICNNIQEEFEYKIKAIDLKGSSDINRYIKYLTKVFEIDIEDTNLHLSIVEQQKLIRNKIAHNNGMTSPEEQAKVQKCVGLSISKYNNIVITEDFLLFLLQHIEEFFKTIEPIIDTRYIEIKKEKGLPT